MKVLGIHDGHNASACLLENGNISYCIQEERLTNQKNFFGFPERAIKKILELSLLSIDEIDYIAMASVHSPEPFDVLERYRSNARSHRGFLHHMAMKTPLYSYYKFQRRKEREKDLLSIGANLSKVEFVDHHLCHASAAYFGAPWRDEKILVLTCDGDGDGLCAAVYTGEDSNLTKIAETKAGNSLGNIYSKTTFMLGLVPWEHEWKIMGMAPYAPPSGMKKSYEKYEKYLDVPQDALVFKRRIHEPTSLIYKRLRRDLEFHRFDWISGGVQQMTEEVLVSWVRNAINKTGAGKVALSGGVFMNVKANKRIMEIPEVEDLFVFPSCGDESNSIGAAFSVYRDKNSESGIESDISPLREIYYGPSFSDKEIIEALERNGLEIEVEKRPDIERDVASILSEGGVVARCAGRMEFGARALGNRSILADPSNQDCIRIINMMVKKRDFWMPFAPVIPAEEQHIYINNPKGISSPYMMLSFDTTNKRSEFMSGVHNADLTARAQILEESYNPKYYNIIREFKGLTGHAVLLNTSFNLHGYPVVNGPSDALWVMENSGLECLALEDYLITKR